MRGTDSTGIVLKAAARVDQTSAGQAAGHAAPIYIQHLDKNQAHLYMLLFRSLA